MEILNKYIYDPQTDMLGKGGFATVYKAYDKILEMDVALKFFHPQDQANKYTIINEIKKAIVLAHPNIVKYYGIETMVNRNFHGQEEQMQIGVMEYVQEGQMKVFLAKNPVSMTELSRLLIDVLEGLKYLHSQGIIHRDIKPQNILLGRDKQNKLIAKIADFGISKAADANQASASLLLGTIEYMAPEQFNPEKYGQNSKVGYNVDIWAFGATAYYLLTNELLFGSRSGDTSAANLINKIVNLEGFEGKLNKVEEPYRTFLSRCIVPDASKRTNDIDELISILKQGTYAGNKTTAIADKPNRPSVNTQETSILPQQPSAPVSKPVKAKKKETPAPAAKPAPAPVSAGDETQIIDYAAVNAGTMNTSASGIVLKKRNKKFKIYAAAASVVIVLATGYILMARKSEEPVTETATAALTKEEIRTNTLNSIDSALIPVPAGTFTMGSDEFENESPAHSTEVAPFKMMSHEVTRRMWIAVMNDNRFTNDSASLDLPATNISWNDVQVFISNLNTLTNKRYRLPSEAEWEYVSTRGMSPALKTDDVAWTVKSAKGKLHTVKSKKPDANGFYDLLGNAYEWCQDWFGFYKKEPGKDGKILRGGDFMNDEAFVSTKIRNMQAPDKSSESIGFRLVESQ